MFMCVFVCEDMSHSTSGFSFVFQADLSCQHTKQSVGAIYTRTNFVTLKYVTDSWGTTSNGFRLVITAVKDPSEYISPCDNSSVLLRRIRPRALAYQMYAGKFSRKFSSFKVRLVPRVIGETLRRKLRPRDV